ncbi:AraC family transcriptional regulator [Aeromonas sp.]|uniref:helix-turn-helix transcriptional regulator n=1 Tax=Aeromonas sp. TaxID=647 RepID=UPI002585598C|nr:AraC family transcriptional regulator [Aeromonas sp.]MCX7127736.1 helix-turn-helix domain-containing protein [Aeromonas sp.]
MYLVSNVALTGYEELVNELGGDTDDLLVMAGLHNVNISDETGFISYPRYAELLDFTAKELNKTLFGLKLASMHGPELLGPLSLGFRLQENVKQALDYLLSHVYLFAYGQILTVKQSHGSVLVGIEYEFGGENPLSQLRQSSCQHLYNYLTSVQVDNIGAMKIHLRQPRPPVHERHYSHVCFSADFDGVSFPAAWLTASLSAGREQMLQFVDKYMDELTSNFPHSYSEQVSSVVHRLLREGQCTMTRVASVLGCGVRSLQLKLQEEGRSYSLILQECRVALAYQLLRRKHMRVTDVAFELGFSDVSTFSRKFKSWTGVSPLQWQKEQQESW